MNREAALIIGSGPASAGAALALVRAGVRPLIIDIGLQLEPELASAVDRMGRARPEGWSDNDRAAITRQPITSLVEGLPEKRSYGSDYPFRNIGQLDGISCAPDAHRSVVSPALGGFSTVWGAQVLPFTPATFDHWPISYEEMEPHYAAVLGEIPYAGDDDDLVEHFPLVRAPDPLPPLAERSVRVLEAYARHRSALRRSGVTVGRARLAMASPECVRCGLCMTGCPYHLIYSADQTLTRLRRAGLIDHRSGWLAVRVQQDSGPPRVTCIDRNTGAVDIFEADKVLLACGALGTTRLVAGSLGLYDRPVAAAESAQITLPIVSLRPTDTDPRHTATFTLNQFNMAVRAGAGQRDLSLLHFYSYNAAFMDALPAVLRHPRHPGVTDSVLRRLSVAIGYLPSWASPRLRLRFAPAGHDRLPTMDVTRDAPRWAGNQMLRSVATSVFRAAAPLDLWPIVPKAIVAAGAKSYHFGATFPHSRNAHAEGTTDRMGRLSAWPDVHLVDASVFPDVPATTFTLTIMANAHRIASELSAPRASQ